MKGSAMGGNKKPPVKEVKKRQGIDLIRFVF